MESAPARANCLLHREDWGKLDFVAVRPDVRLVACRDQTRTQPHAPPVDANAAFQDVVRA